MVFDVVLDEAFVNFYLEPDATKYNKKSILGLINDFEDGNWRFEKFQEFIWDNIAETSLSFRERNSLISKPMSLLSESARNLRLTDAENDISKGSELAEIVLYGIMKNHYQALPVVPKIFYKQNVQDNAKGADSVHIVVTDDDFSIWFGEAKFYNSIDDDRLDTIITSVENSLKSDKLKKENSIITSVSDIEHLVLDEGLRSKIKKCLSNQESIDYLKPRIHVPIFLLHECKITKEAKTLTQEYKDSIIEYHKERALSYFKKQNKRIQSIIGYTEINFHLILFPVPEKINIVDSFINKVRFFKGK